MAFDPNTSTLGGQWAPYNPLDPYGGQQFSGGKDWNLTKPGPGFIGIPYMQTYGGQPAPYADSGAQILDTMRIAGLVPGKPPNPLMGNRAGRYSFGGGGGYGNQYGLLGGPGGGPVVPGGGGGGNWQPRAGPQGGQPPPTGDNFPGLPTNGAAGGSGQTGVNGLGTGLLSNLVGSGYGQDVRNQAFQQLGNRNVNALQSAQMLDPNVTGAMQQYQYGFTPDQAAQNMTRQGLQGQTPGFWQQQIGQLYNQMQGAGLQQDPTHGYPADSPFNPMNPNSPFYNGSQQPQFSDPNAVTPGNPFGAINTPARSR